MCRTMVVGRAGKFRQNKLSDAAGTCTVSTRVGVSFDQLMVGGEYRPPWWRGCTNPTAVGRVGVSARSEPRESSHYRTIPLNQEPRWRLFRLPRLTSSTTGSTVPLVMAV